MEFETVFPASEAELLRRLDAFVDSGSTPLRRELRSALDRGFPRMEALAKALAVFPSLKEKERLGSRERDSPSLIQRLLESGDQALEWVLPTKAIVSRAFGIAKVHFWSALILAGGDECESAPGPDEWQALLPSLRGAWEEAIYTRLAEELYGSFVTSRTAPQELRRRAASSALDLWDGRIPFSAAEFCPILRSAWAARTRSVRTFGTLMGTVELVDLLFRDCPGEFVHVFLDTDRDLDTLQAFDEFLFDLPSENLAMVRRRMAEEGRQSVGLDQIADYLGEDPERLRPRTGDPRATYSSFRRRRIRAQYRTYMRTPGPKRTAESYVLEALLMHVS